MQRTLSLLFLGFCCHLILALPLFAEVPDFSELAERLKPAVVNISTATTVKPRTPHFRGPQGPGQDMFEDFFDRFFREGPQRSPRKARSLGTGFIISEDGYILTNDHVVDGADEIKVKLADGREFSGTVRGLDPKLDLALIKIDAGEDLPVAKLGDSEQLKVGEWVMAIGNPFGLSQTVTVGIVSAKGRVIGAGPYDNFIQTDASINPGNSGGPLFNLKGEVVGINTAIAASGQGIGFAIPVKMAKQIIPQLREEGYVTRGWLGVTVQPLTDDLAESFDMDKAAGALVTDVTKGSPADKAGLQRGDVIVEFDGQAIDSLNDLPRIVAGTVVGKQVEVLVYRDGKQRALKAKVGKLEGEEQTSPQDDNVTGTLGLKIANPTSTLLERYGLDEGRGVLVVGVDADGPAADSNLKVGDLIVEVDSRDVKSVADFEKAVSKSKPGKVLRLLVQRQVSLFYTTIKVEEKE